MFIVQGHDTQSFTAKLFFVLEEKIRNKIEFGVHLLPFHKG